MFNKASSAVCIAFVLAAPLSGCYLASNGLDYSHEAVIKPALPPPPPPAPEPVPVAIAPPCQATALGGCKTGDKVVLTGVNFEFNKSTLTLNAKSLLDPVAESLKATGVKVEIDGFTDAVGSDIYNNKLSGSRAKSVEEYLISRGVVPSQLSAMGFGKAMPIADNSTEEGREMNRRVELKVLGG